VVAADVLPADGAQFVVHLHEGAGTPDIIENFK
jgi:hypothetical protein